MCIADVMHKTQWSPKAGEYFIENVLRGKATEKMVKNIVPDDVLASESKQHS